MQQSEMTPIFFEDFTSTTLDRTKWNVEVTGNIHNNEQQAYIDSEETIYLQQDIDDSKGVLVIHPRFKPGYINSKGDHFDFVSGRINTFRKFEFKYGSVSARIKLPMGDGLWPAFWTLGTDGYWPNCGELDIMEYAGEHDWTSVAIHGPEYSGETPLVNKKYFNQPGNANHWHVYTLEWLPTGLFFYVDDDLVYRVPRVSVEYLGDWVFDQKHFLILNFAIGGNYPFKVNGIQKPYYGISETTVRAIQNNEIRLLIDWIKVTQM